MIHRGREALEAVSLWREKFARLQGPPAKTLRRKKKIERVEQV